MELNDDTVDLLLVSLGVGLTAINYALFALYLFLRLQRDGRLKGVVVPRSNKADRPAWITGTLIAGTVWLFASLHLSGSFTLLTPTRLTCVLVKYWAQYTFGYILWICCIVYRLVRLYMVMTLVRKPWHALAVLSLLLVPMAVLSTLALFLSGMYPRIDAEGVDVCVQPAAWNYALYTVSIMYFVLFVYLAVRLRRVTGSFDQLRRYMIYCILSFAFLAADFVLAFTDGWAYALYRQLNVLVVAAIVAAHTWSLFSAVFDVGKKPRMADAKGDDQFADAVVGTDETARRATSAQPAPATRQSRLVEMPWRQHASSLPPTIDFFAEHERMEESRRRDTFLGAVSDFFRNFFRHSNIESAEEDADLAENAVSHYMVPRNFVLSRPPRRSLSDEMLPDFEAFVASLSEEDAVRVNRAQGYFDIRHRPRTKEVLDVDIEAAFKYLTGRGDPKSEEAGGGADRRDSVLLIPVPEEGDRNDGSVAAAAAGGDDDGSRSESRV